MRSQKVLFSHRGTEAQRNAIVFNRINNPYDSSPCLRAYARSQPGLFTGASYLCRMRRMNEVPELRQEFNDSLAARGAPGRSNADAISARGATGGRLGKLNS